MKDYITLGSAPCGEDCVQLGSDNYHKLIFDECKRYIKQLRRQFGLEPEGAKLKIKEFPHDFGTYHEVVCWYEEDNEIAENYAFELEGNIPEKWDGE
jgi:hypothetical protein